MENGSRDKKRKENLAFLYFLNLSLLKPFEKFAVFVYNRGKQCEDYRFDDWLQRSRKEVRAVAFEINDKVVYGVMGVCEIVNIARPPISGVDGDYYYLQPIYDSKGIIYSPVKSNKVMMRYIMTKEECDKLYVRAKNCTKDVLLNEPVSSARYDDMIKSQDALELLHLVRVLYNIKNERAKDLRKMKSADSRMLIAARKLLYGEMAAVQNRELSDMTEEMDALLCRS